MQKRQFALALVVVAVLIGSAIALWQVGLWRVFGDREAFGQLIDAFGPWGPVALIVAEILQVLFAPVPGQLVGIMAGYLYGALWGTVLCMIGLSLGTWLAIWLARRLGRPLVERLAGEELVARIDGYAQRRGALAFFLIFLLPFLPDDICCFIAGLTPLRIGELVILAIIGRAPGVIVSTLIGARAESLTWAQLGGLALIGIILAALFARYQRPLERVMFRVLDRFVAEE